MTNAAQMNEKIRKYVVGSKGAYVKWIYCNIAEHTKLTWNTALHALKGSELCYRIHYVD